MRIIQNDNDFISLTDITNQHILVTVINNCPCILVKKGEYLEWAIIASTTYEGSTNLTSGNCYDYTGKIKTIPEMIKATNEYHPKAEIQVFTQNNWKEALQFLINNA